MTDLETPRSRWRVVNFWATWCRPCMAEMPGLRTFGEQNPEVDLVFVNVDLPSLHEGRVKKTIERLRLERFEHLALDDADPAGALNAIADWPDSLPVTFVIDPNGKRIRQFNTAIQPSILERAIP